MYILVTIVMLFLIGTIGVFTLSRFYISKQIEWDGKSNEINLPDFSVIGAHIANVVFCFAIAVILLWADNTKDKNTNNLKFENGRLEQRMLKFEELYQKELAKDDKFISNIRESVVDDIINELK